jgi:hypothetical protein
MLQVSLGGHRLASTTEITMFDDNYQEPGFIKIEPLIMSLPEADRIYILIRQRADVTGSTFSELGIADLTPTITDSTNNESVPTITDSTNNESVPAIIDIVSYDNFGIDDPYDSTLLLIITNCFSISSPTNRVRSMDCFIKHTNGDFIRFRVNVGDSGKLFHYLIIDNNDFANRGTSTMSGLEAVVKVGGSTDIYMLVSPYAYLKESTNGQGDFSYPIDSVYYTRQSTFNDEDFEFSIDRDQCFVDNASLNSFLSNIQIINVPSYSKTGVLLIDKYIYNYLTSLRTEAYITIKVIGKVSGLIDYFKIYLVQ